MAIVTVSQYAELAADAFGRDIQAPLEPAIAEQQLDVTGGQVKTVVLDAATLFVFITGDAAVRYKVSEDGDAATTESTRLPLDGERFFAVRAGMQLSVRGE